MLNWPADVNGYEPEGAKAADGDDLIGRKLGVYEVRRLIGSGGMGDVYEGFHPGLERTAALKVINRDLAGTQKARERFEREARSAGRLRHPNAITIYDFGMDHGRMYLAMELMDGEDLESVMAWEGVLQPARFMSIFRPACEAVHAAHGQRVIHRDLKPSNIFLDRCGAGREVIKVMDFGLAWLVGEGDHRLTGKSVVGTPSFIAPEQLLGHEVGPRSDVYSLGVMAFQCLTGELPFRDDGDLGQLWERIANELPPLERFEPWMYPFAQVIGRSLSKLPSERQESPLELAEELAEALDRCHRPPSSTSLISAVHSPPALLAVSALPPGLRPADAQDDDSGLPSLDPTPAPGSGPGDAALPVGPAAQAVVPEALIRAVYALAAASALSAVCAAAAVVASLVG